MKPIFQAIIALLLVAQPMEAQVSVRRTSRNKSDETSAPATPRRSNSDASTSRPRRSNGTSAGELTSSEGQKSANSTPSNTPKVTATPKKSTLTATKKTDATAPKFADGKSLRQRQFDEYQKESQEETPWHHIVYRVLDLTLEENASLYFPIEPQDGLTNLFRVIMEAYAKGELTTYEYLGDREVLTDRYKTKPQEILDKFEIAYEIQTPNGRNGAEVYVLDEAGLPCNEVLSYYIKERWEFDQKHSRYVPRILCLCPVLHRSSESGNSIDKYPMFWINYEDLRPLLRNHLIVSSGFNNAPRYTMEEYFRLNQYKGTIYKDQNLRGLTMQQLYPNPDTLRIRQQELDDKLHNFGKAIWVEEESAAAAEATDRKTASKTKTAAEPTTVTTTSEAAAGADATETKTRKSRRTRETVEVDAAAEAAKKSKPRSVRR